MAWIAAIGIVGIAIYLALRGGAPVLPGSGLDRPTALPASIANAGLAGEDLPVSVPPFIKQGSVSAISRRPALHTIIPTRPRLELRVYTVVQGDSLFEIAHNFGLKPETVLWANYDLLNDNPDSLSIGMELKIPPVDGVFYEWKGGDTLEGVAARFKAEVEAILGWSGNNLDLTAPQIEAGKEVMIPGGSREFRQWVIPDIPRGKAGVSKSLFGGGACEGGYEGAFGSGSFIWPAGNHKLSGNDYWDGHLGIDIAAGEGAPIYASDSGVVVFAGSAFGGYGNMVMLDHGNGYQTLYAHLSKVTASCGSSVSQGGIIGYSGSTGNSTGAHLHFEIRFQGGFVSPWFVLPPP